MPANAEGLADIAANACELAIAFIA